MGVILYSRFIILIRFTLVKCAVALKKLTTEMQPHTTQESFHLMGIIKNVH